MIRPSLSSRTNIRKIALFIGLIAALVGIGFWFSIIFTNLFVSNRIEVDFILTTFLMVFLPACLALASLWLDKPSTMYIAFLWSLPMGFYFALAQALSRWYGLVSVLYLISAILMTRQKLLKI